MGFSKKPRRLQTQSLQDLTLALDAGSEVHDELESVKRELWEIELIKARATVFRVFNWSQVGERPTKYFLNFEKRNHVSTRKRISQLEDEAGQLKVT